MYGYEQVRRSLIMGDHVFSIGRLGMKISDAETVEEVATVSFPSEDEFFNQDGFSTIGFEGEEDQAWEEEPMLDTPVPVDAESDE